jgi:hypothetical protein
MSGVDVYRVYPWRNVALYNGATLLHFGLAAIGVIVAYDRWPALGWVVAVAYLLFALGQMYVVMPLVVCCSCVYHTMLRSRCVSGLNVVSQHYKRIEPLDEFEARRTQGPLCHNNLYMAALIAPIPLILVGLIVNFSLPALVLMLAVAGLLAFRFFVVFQRTACPHCAAKGRCPNAKAMGIA